MRLIDADELNKVKFHPLPYTHITPSDVEVESYKRGWNDAVDAIMTEAPTIEPEIIHCKDCKWKQGAECVRFADVRPFPEDFCSRAERREEGKQDE